MFSTLLIFLVVFLLLTPFMSSASTNKKSYEEDSLDDEDFDAGDIDDGELEELLQEYGLEEEIEEALSDGDSNEYEKAGLLTGQYLYIECPESYVKSRSGYCQYPIRGMQFRALQLSDIGCFEGYAKAEKDNKYDEYAIAIFREDNKHIGYLPAANEQLHNYIMNNGGYVHCEGCIMAKHTKRNRFYGEVIVECDKTHVDERNKSDNVDKYYSYNRNWLKDFLDKAQT